MQTLANTHTRAKPMEQKRALEVQVFQYRRCVNSNLPKKLEIATKGKKKGKGR